MKYRRTVAAISVLFALIMVSLFFFKEEITGLVFVGEPVYTDKISAVLKDGESFNWTPSVSGNITSVRISGSLIGNGSAKIYLKAGFKYLIYDTTNKPLPAQITGFIVAEEGDATIDDDSSGNEADKKDMAAEDIPEEVSETDEAVVEASEDAEAAIKSTTIEANATSQNGAFIQAPDNGRGASATDTATKKITTNLAYKSGTEFDQDDDGVTAPDQVVDLTVENTQFSWPANEETLCTRWEITNLEKETSGFACQGSEVCCSFVGVDPTASSWKEPLYLYKSLYSSGSSNMVSAQVLSVKLNETAIELEIAQSGLVSLPVSFVDLASPFNDVCEETCSLGSEGKFSIEVEAEDAEVSIANITYGVREQNQDPVCAEMPDIVMTRNSEHRLNLSGYCSDPEHEALAYTASDLENMSVTIISDTIILVPQLDFVGKQYGFLKVSDARSQITTNVFEINVIDEILRIDTKKPSVVIGKPVRWIKVINLATPTTITLPIHAQATNISVRKIEAGRETLVNNKVEVKEGFEIKPLAEYEQESRKRAQEQSATQEGALITGAAIQITGFAALEEENDTTELIINEPITQAEVEYYTKGPVAEEVSISDTRKRITISSDVHYEDILAFTGLPREASQFALFWLTNGSRVKVETTKYDTNNNSLTDYIEWVIPSLSNQTYELSLEILTLHSVARLGENWTVYFSTTGTGNLTISLIVNDTYNTTWGEWPEDNESTLDHLRFIDLRGKSGNDSYLPIDHERELDPITGKIIKIKKEDWNYSEGTLINEWLIEDYHAIQFNFSGIIAYALNAPPTQTAPLLNSTDASNNDSQNLTCWNQSTADADGHNVTNIFTWYKNGVRNVSSGILNGTTFDNGLVGWWPFDDDAYDYRLENNGTLYGNAFINKLGGIIGGGAAQFDGNGDWLNISNSSAFSFNDGDFAISLWFYTSTNVGGAHRGLITNRNVGNTKGGIFIEFDGSTDSPRQIRVVSTYGNGTGVSLYGPYIAVLKWYHTVFTRSGTNFSLYLSNSTDNQNFSTMLVGSWGGIDAVRNTTDGWNIGKLYTDTDNNFFFPGFVDEVKIYNRSLNESEIREQYISGVGNHSDSMATMHYNFTVTGEQWICQVTPIDFKELGTPLNSSVLTIGNAVNVIYPRWSIQNSSGSNIASIDNAGNMFIVGTLTENLALNSYNNSFVVINSSGSVAAIINQSGLYLADPIAQNIAIGSGVPINSLIIQNASDTLAYFSDTGNLTLKGTLTQNYATP